MFPSFLKGQIISLQGKILVTGGAGFIGSALVKKLIETTSCKVHVLDALTYAGNLASLDPIMNDSNFSYSQTDICDRSAVKQQFEEFEPDIVMHLAAESHVDRSIDGPAVFIETNLIGTFNLLSVAHEYWDAMPVSRKEHFRFHHVSTDEVFGSLDSSGFFKEDTPYSPRSPYSASKAGSDHLVSAWHHTYGLPVLLTNCSNNYGPCQFPEKLIPLTIINCITNKKLPVYGDGKNVRDWLYVDDHVDAMMTVVEKGIVGDSYLIGGNQEQSTLQVVEKVCDILDRKRPRSDGRSYQEQISFVTDRPGHDFRYAIDSSKLQNELGWKPTEKFESGLEKTIDWYLGHEKWWQDILSGANKKERLDPNGAG